MIILRITDILIIYINLQILLTVMHLSIFICTYSDLFDNFLAINSLYRLYVYRLLPSQYQMTDRKNNTLPTNIL